MSKFSVHKRHETTRLRDYGTMTCDYDNDHFNQELKFQYSRESGHSHGQWSWSKSPEVPRQQLNS